MARHGRLLAFSGNSEFFIGPRARFWRQESFSERNRLINGNDAPDLIYVNVPVYCGPETLARYSRPTKSIDIAMTLQKSPGLQAKM
jgi:hypothetical protein